LIPASAACGRHVADVLGPLVDDLADVREDLGAGGPRGLRAFLAILTEPSRPVIVRRGELDAAELAPLAECGPIAHGLLLVGASSKGGRGQGREVGPFNAVISRVLARGPYLTASRAARSTRFSL
jgi:hypothetical protein